MVEKTGSTKRYSATHGVCTRSNNQDYQIVRLIISFQSCLRQMAIARLAKPRHMLYTYECLEAEQHFQQGVFYGLTFPIYPK